MYNRWKRLLINSREQSDKLCLSAVRDNGLLLEYVVHQSDYVCLVAVRQNGKAINKIRNEQVLIDFLVKYPKYFKYLTPERKTVNLQLSLLKRDSLFATKVDKHILNLYPGEIPPPEKVTGITYFRMYNINFVMV